MNNDLNYFLIHYQGVGKTSFQRRFCCDAYQDNYSRITTADAVKIKTLQHQGCSIKLEGKNAILMWLSNH